MYEYGVSFKSERHLQNMADFIFTLDVLHFFLNDEKSYIGVHALSGHLAKRQNPILQAVSPVSQNLPVESLNQFYIFLARKYASFGHSAYFRNHYARLSSHLRAKYGKSPPKILSIFTVWQHKFSPNVLIWSKYLSIIETTGWYLSIDMCFVLVDCCVGMLMTSCLWRTTLILTQKNYASETYIIILSNLNPFYFWVTILKFPTFFNDCSISFLAATVCFCAYKTTSASRFFYILYICPVKVIGTSAVSLA